MDNSYIDALNFKVRSIEHLLGIKFEGKSLIDKQEFVAKHWEARMEVSYELLADAWEDAKKRYDLREA